MHIFIYKTEDGVKGADFSKVHAKAQGKIIKTIEAHNIDSIQRVIDDPGPELTERVRALAERALEDWKIRNNMVEPTKPPLKHRIKMAWRMLTRGR